MNPQELTNTNILAPGGADLFPETLLVSREGEHIYTTSLKVAEYFGKNHYHVLRAVKSLIVDCTDVAFNESNFGFVEYKDKKGETRPMYELSHDGFALLAMGFTGKEALVWKVNFLKAFRTQERALAQLTERYAHVADAVRPYLRPVVEGTERGQSRADIAQPLGKSAAAVTYHRAQARRFGLLQPKGAQS